MARLANSLVQLRNQVNAAFPNRNKASDGWIGDAAHAASASDHNPNGAGVVCALDITNSPQTGFDVHALADRLRVNRHPNLKYIISNRRICGAWTGWNWWPYNGSNPHSAHAHFSVGRGNDGQSQPPYDDTSNWAIGGAVTPPQGGKSLDDVAREVLAGKWGNDPERSNKLRAAGYDAGAVQGRVNQLLGGGGAAPRKSNEVVAAEVINGAWGNGADRVNALRAAGYDPNAIQAIVNGRVSAPAAPARASVDQIADQVIAGAWGTGPDRVARLQRAGYNAQEVQNRVNAKLGYGAAPTRKSEDQVANEIIAGQGGWGTNPQRAQKLAAAGYNAQSVQNLVNRKLGY